MISIYSKRSSTRGEHLSKASTNSQQKKPPLQPLARICCGSRPWQIPRGSDGSLLISLAVEFGQFGPTTSDQTWQSFTRLATESRMERDMGQALKYTPQTAKLCCRRTRAHTDWVVATMMTINILIRTTFASPIMRRASYFAQTWVSIDDG